MTTNSQGGASKWLRFENNHVSASGKTLVFDVVAKDGGAILGEVRWFGRWRTYAFFPGDGTIYEPTCLRDLADFIKAQMSARWLTREGAR